jgi:3-hydroxyisobutyrate dehydrogenase
MSMGYIGLGNMGGALARRLLLSQELTVFDLDPAVVEDCVAAGATAANGVRAIAESCETVMMCLPTSNEVRSVIFDPDGLRAGLRPGSLVVDMTTGDPKATREMAAMLADDGIEMIDAPVSGGPQGADAGTIAIMVGASAAQFERIRPVLASISPNVFHAGDVGAGHIMKVVNNVMSAANRAIAFEAVTLAVKNGIDPRVCVDIVQKGSGRNCATEVTFPKFVLAEDLAQGFSLGLMHKDAHAARQSGARDLSERDQPERRRRRHQYADRVLRKGRQDQGAPDLIVSPRRCCRAR